VQGDALRISIVVPVYGCADCLAALHSGLLRELSGLVDDEYEIVFVDDGSRDGAWPLLERIAANDRHVVALQLSRNFGQHAAITAGLAESRGDWVVVMDCDLQHPPEELPRLYRTATEGGYDIVFTRRRGGGHSLFRRAASWTYFTLMNRMIGLEMTTELSNYSVVSRQVVDEFLRVGDRERQYLMILHWLGFRTATIEFDHQERYAGRSAYSLLSLIRFALDGLFFQTTVLLRWIVYLGFVISGAGVGLAIYLVVHHLVSPRTYPGWTSLVVLLLLLAGFIIVSTGVSALYVGKIFGQVKSRPLYVVAHRRGGSGSLDLPPAQEASGH
jgi:dolichol-phosphate mannosyltransferase